MTNRPRRCCLLALATLLPLLVPAGRARATEIQPSSDLLVPYFEVVLDAWCRTTLFAVVNDGDDPVTVTATVHTNWGIPMVHVERTLQADEVWTVNLRDWVLFGDLPGRAPLAPDELAHLQASLAGNRSPIDHLFYASDEDPERDVATGYVTLRTGGTVRPDVLWGDYFILCTDEDFLQGETLVDIGASRHGQLCRTHAIRFSTPYDLGGETELLLWAAGELPPSADPTPPAPVARLRMDCYDESGKLIHHQQLDVDAAERLDLSQFDLPEDYGWTELRTDADSFVTGHYQIGRWSASLHAWCMPEQGVVEGPAVRVEKLVDGADADSPPGLAVTPGSPLAFTFEVTNIGSERLRDVAVSDDSGLVVSCPKTTLDAGEAMTCTAAATAEACQHQDVATVVAWSLDGVEVTDSDPAYTFGALDTELQLENQVDGHDADVAPGPRVEVGADLTFAYHVRNAGAAQLTQLTVIDDQGVEVVCPSDVLASKQKMVCTATARAEAGAQVNVATASGQPECGPAVTVVDAAHYFGWQPAPAIDVEKRVDGEDADLPPGPTVELGQLLSWSYLVTNVGDVGLSGITVTDSDGTAVTCSATSLEPGQAMTCTGSGIAAACQQQNVATATGNPVGGGGAVSDQDPVHYFGQHHAAIALEKRVQGEDADLAPGPGVRVGAALDWHFVVTNTGDVPLSDVAASDVIAVACPKTALAAGESMTCTASGAALAGQQSNLGAAIGTPPCGPPVTAFDPAHYYGRTPAIALQKLTNGEDADVPPGPTVAVGTAVLWSYVVTNTGDVAVTDLAVTDDRGLAVTCPKTTLAAGESMTCTAAGTAVAGQYANIGTVTGVPALGGAPAVTASDPSHHLGVGLQLSLEKRVNGQDADACGPGGVEVQLGSTLTFTYLVTNTGDVTLTAVAVTDDRGLTVTCPKTTLATGEAMTCTATGTAVLGEQPNLGTAGGSWDGRVAIATDPACYTGIGGTANLGIEKLVNGLEADTPPGPIVAVGAAVLWTYVVTNTGTVPLFEVTVTDSDGVTVSCPKATLEAGETISCTAGGVAVGGQQANIGRASGTPAGGAAVTAEDAAHYLGRASDQGCPPGYWKNHTDSWPPTGYSSTQKVKTVFPSVMTFYPSLGNATLWQALAFGGGPGGEGGAEILLRAAVAALLNASHPDVAHPRTPSAVTAAVDAALLQSRDAMLALAASLDADNNLGCPLH